jgi:hypothetical protein
VSQTDHELDSRLQIRSQTVKRISLLLAAAVILAACSNSPTAPSQASIVGRWNLTTAYGAPLPVITAQTDQSKTEITANVLTFLADGTFTQVTTVRSTLNGAVTVQTFNNAGPYTVNGTAVTYSINGFSGPPFTGIINGSTLTVTDSTGSSVYQKQ